MHPRRWTIDARDILFKIAQLFDLVEKESLFTPTRQSVPVHTEEVACTRTRIVDKNTGQGITRTGGWWWRFFLAPGRNSVDTQKYEQSLPHSAMKFDELPLLLKSAPVFATFGYQGSDLAAIILIYCPNRR
jgi:hypothetical protein